MNSIEWGKRAVEGHIFEKHEDESMEPIIDENGKIPQAKCPCGKFKVDLGQSQGLVEDAMKALDTSIEQKRTYVPVELKNLSKPYAQNSDTPTRYSSAKTLKYAA